MHEYIKKNVFIYFYLMTATLVQLTIHRIQLHTKTYIINLFYWISNMIEFYELSRNFLILRYKIKILNIALTKFKFIQYYLNHLIFNLKYKSKIKLVFNCFLISCTTHRKRF